MSNSTVVLLPPSTRVFVHALSHADLKQRIRINPPPGHGESAIFSGAGENVTMALETPGFITPRDGGWAYFDTPPLTDPQQPDERHPYTVTVESPEKSNLHTAPYEAEAGLPGKKSRYATLMVVSEDLEDRDFNDSVLLFNYFIPPPKT